ALPGLAQWDQDTTSRFKSDVCRFFNDVTLAREERLMVAADRIELSAGERYLLLLAGDGTEPLDVLDWAAEAMAINAAYRSMHRLAKWFSPLLWQQLIEWARSTHPGHAIQKPIPSKTWPPGVEPGSQP